MDLRAAALARIERLHHGDNYQTGMMQALGIYLGSKKPFKTVSIVAEDSDFGRGGSDAFKSIVVPKAGLEIVSTDIYPQNTPDFTSILTEHSDDIEQVLHITPNGLSNFYNIYNPAQGTVGGLLTLPNFIAAPHVAGVTREAVDRMAVVAVQNILSIFDGKPNSENVVNKDVLE